MNYPTLRVNDGWKNNVHLNADVRLLQETLNIQGFSVGTPDGKFGSGTEKIVKEFQQSRGLDADGIVGSGTWEALMEGAYPTLRVNDGWKNNPDLNDKVKLLQEKLNAQGFSAGTPDGKFGSGTERVVKEFQQSRSLDADGIVGHSTWEALMKGVSGASAGGSTIKFDSDLATPQLIANVYQCPLSQTQKYLPGVLAAMDKYGILNRLTLIGACSTIRIETGGFQPINEYGGTKYFTKMYEGRRDLGNTQRGDGARYHGRGFIQITGRANYREYGKKLGIGNQLENNPELAMDPKYGAEILARYFKDRGVDKAARAQDWRKARRLVNGGYNGWDEFIHFVNRGLAKM